MQDVLASEPSFATIFVVVAQCFLPTQELLLLGEEVLCYNTNMAPKETITLVIVNSKLTACIGFLVD